MLRIVQLKIHRPPTRKAILQERLRQRLTQPVHDNLILELPVKTKPAISYALKPIKANKSYGSVLPF